MKEILPRLAFLILITAVFSVVTASPTYVSATTEDDGWVEGDYEGSPEEQEEQAQEDWEDAGRPGDEEDDNDDDNEDQYEGLPTPEEAGETGVVDCGNGVFVEPREPCPLGYQECENGELIPAGRDCPESSNVFAPDKSCLFNVNQPICIPPEGVDCPEGFGTNDDGYCFPFNELGEWECPQGYHSIEDDETGQCYPDSQPCPVNSIMGDNGNCISKHWCEGDNPIAECPDKDRDIEFNPPTTPDLNCGDPGVPKNFKVQSGDPHDFDRDADGIGCEDNEFSVGGNNNSNTKVIQKTTVINSASSSSPASSSAAEVSSCRVDGSSDGILQKFDSAKYQACGLHVDGQKAYSDGFIIGCTQVGNTQLICQALVDSSILNMNPQSAQLAAQLLSTQAATQPIQEGIQPSAVRK
jgi:hypothetical protein